MAIASPQACRAVWKAVVVHDYVNAKRITPALFIDMLASVYDSTAYSCIN
jgi:hypothetical protein